MTGHHIEGRGIGTLERIRFGEYLLERKAIDDGQLLDALADHWAHGGRFGMALQRRGILNSEDVERLAAEYHAIQVVIVAPDSGME
jgi:hypothetical protein